MNYTIELKNYLTINECINRKIIELSSKQLKRRIKSILNDATDNRVIYSLKNGIKTIVLAFDYAREIKRNRKAKKKIFTNDNVVIDFNNSLIKTEITIVFNEEFDSQRLKCIVDYYDSDFPIFYQTEGTTKDKKHLHLGVCEDIENAKLLICESLQTNGIELVNTNVKISQIANIEAYEEYLEKYGSLSFKNFNYTMLSKEYLQHCYNHNFENQIMMGLVSDFGKDYFESRVFDYKRKLPKELQP